MARVVEELAGPQPPVEIRQIAVPGHAARVLLDRSCGADLPIAGSPGHGGFTDALLGSVSLHCVEHASCLPVVVRGTVGCGPGGAGCWAGWPIAARSRTN
ncbi:universal stress protein [Kitasatospora sp. NPDC085464]|uniref:universal stress protein n=1 Tax=Kitasatospora sp. NPDC085464 TaxID=3364063 RepID=UPI0037C72082